MSKVTKEVYRSSTEQKMLSVTALDLIETGIVLAVLESIGMLH